MSDDRSSVTSTEAESVEMTSSSGKRNKSTAKLRHNELNSEDEEVKSEETEPKKNCSDIFLLKFDGVFRTYWDSLMGFVLVYVCLWLPFGLAFYDEKTGPYPDGKTPFFLPIATVTIDLITDVYFYLDVPVNFITTFESDEGVIITSHCKIAKRYLSGWFFIDVFSTLPMDQIMGGSLSKMSKLVKVLRMMKLLKMLRLSKLGRLIPQLQAQYDIKNSTLSVIKFLLTIFITAHWSGCGFFLLARWQEFPTDSWVRQRIYQDKPLLFHPILTQYLHCVYWAVTIMTTIGFGDILPGTDVERGFVTGIMFLGACIFAYGISNMCVVVLNLDADSVKFAELQDKINFFLVQQEVPKQKIKAVKDYLMYKYYSSEIDMFGGIESLEKMSKTIRARFFEEICQKYFADCKIISRHGDFFIRCIGQHLKGKVYAPYETIVLEGYKHKDIFLISQGKIEVVTGPHFDYLLLSNSLTAATSADECADDLVVTTDSIIEELELQAEQDKSNEKNNILQPTYNLLHPTLKSVRSEESSWKYIKATRMYLSEGSTLNEVAGLLGQDSTVSAFAKNHSDVYSIDCETYLTTLHDYYPGGREELLDELIKEQILKFKENEVDKSEPNKNNDDDEGHIIDDEGTVNDASYKGNGKLGAAMAASITANAAAAFAVSIYANISADYTLPKEVENIELVLMDKKIETAVTHTYSLSNTTPMKLRNLIQVVNKIDLPSAIKIQLQKSLLDREEKEEDKGVEKRFPLSDFTWVRSSVRYAELKAEILEDSLQSNSELLLSLKKQIALYKDTNGTFENIMEMKTPQKSPRNKKVHPS